MPKRHFSSENITATPDKRGAFNWSMQHHLGTKLFKGGVYDPTKTVETYSRAEAEDRAIPGHWEGDLLAGGKNSYIATLVERHSRFLMLIKVPSKDTAVVVAALSKRVRKLPATPAALIDVGSRIGDGRAQGVYGCNRCAGVLLRSTKSLAAWHERKHQSTPAAILPARDRLSSHHSSGARPGRAALESTSKKNSRISNSSE
jgi:hypothetical protein